MVTSECTVSDCDHPATSEPGPAAPVNLSVLSLIQNFQLALSQTPAQYATQDRATPEECIDEAARVPVWGLALCGV